MAPPGIPISRHPIRRCGLVLPRKFTLALGGGVMGEWPLFSKAVIRLRSAQYPLCANSGRRRISGTVLAHKLKS
jgi:hypothetical protein